MSEHLLEILDQPAAEQVETIGPAQGAKQRGRLKAMIILRCDRRHYPRAEWRQAGGGGFAANSRVG
jgi:hypothetical protein